MPETLPEHGTITAGLIRNPISEHPDFFLELHHENGEAITACFTFDEFVDIVTALNKKITECHQRPAGRPWWHFWKRGR